MNSEILKDSSKMFSDKEFLKLRSNLIIDGVELAIEIKRLVKNLLFLH